MSLDEEKNVKEPKGRPAREWWKEEYCDKLVRKRKKNKKKQGIESSTHNLNNNNWWQKDDEMYVDNRKKKRSRSTSRGSRAMIQQPCIPSSGLMTGSNVLIRAKEYPCEDHKYSVTLYISRRKYSIHSVNSPLTFCNSTTPKWVPSEACTLDLLLRGQVLYH
nr:receptor-like serine/threonine-protein kinase At4g25390 [Tanacetum cinerariifolium]